MKSKRTNASILQDPEDFLDAIDRAHSFDGWKLPYLDYPTFRLALVAKIMDRLTIRQLTAFGLSYAEWRVLSRLANSGRLSVRQIAERAWVDRAEVSRAAKSLQKRGLAGRRENPKDRRMPFLYLTEAGRACHAPVVQARRRFHAAVMADLGGRERKQLDELLLKMAARLLEISTNH